MKTLLTVLVLCVSGSTLPAQDTPRPFEVGISTLVSTSMNTVTPPRGWRIVPSVHSLPDVTVITVLPVWQSAGIAAGLDLGLSSNGVRCSSTVDAASSFALDMRYASVIPTVIAGNVFAGCGIHLPLSARRTLTDGSQSSATVTMAGKEVGLRSLVGTLIDVRAGLVLPFIEDEHGVLSGLLSCSYQVSSFFTTPDVTGAVVYGAATPTAAVDPAAVHLRAGLRYLFSFHGSDDVVKEQPATESSAPDGFPSASPGP
ncbi:MAG: hypothetical protein ACKOB6_09690 [Candidatus Kapaibacterium sp.]